MLPEQMWNYVAWIHKGRKDLHAMLKNLTMEDEES